MLRVTAAADPLAREDLAFALSVVLLGLLMMVTRRNAVSQVVGFMSLENGLVLAATGAKGMPLVVEISVAFSILIAFIVIGIFLFRIRERFNSVEFPPSTTSGANGDERIFRAAGGGPAYPDRLGRVAGRAARLPPVRAPQCCGELFDASFARFRCSWSTSAAGDVLAGRRSQHRLHRAQHLRRLYHQRL